MIVNLIVIFIIIISALIYWDKKGIDVNSTITRKKYIVFICIILILQSGLRNVAVGADTYAYYLHFEKIKHLSWIKIYDVIFKYYSLGIGKDPGYTAFQKIIQYIIPNYQLFLLLIAIIYFSALGNFIFKNTTRFKEVIFAFILYSTLFYTFFSITGLRQTIASAATLWGYELIKKRKLISFLMLILLASTIHKSCLIFIPFYFIAHAKNTKYFYALAILSLPVLMYFRNSVSTFLSVWGGYENYEYYKGAGTFTFTFMLVAIALLSWWRLQAVTEQNKITQQYFNAFILAIIFVPLTWVNPSAMRIVQYFSIFMLVLIPPVIHSLGNMSFKLHKIVYTFALVILILLSIKNQKGMEYKFFWQEMQLGENYKKYR